MLRLRAWPAVAGRGSSAPAVRPATSHGVASGQHVPPRVHQDRDDHRDSARVNGKDHVVDTRTVTLDVGQTDQPAGPAGDRRVVVRRPPDRRHRRRPELDRRAAGGVPLRPARVPRRRLDVRCRPAEQLSPETAGPRRAASERYQDSPDEPSRRTGWIEYASTTGDRSPGARSTLPHDSRLQEHCTGRAAPVQYWVPFVAADGTSTTGAQAVAAGEPPEAQTSAASALPSNETFGVTGLDGTGSAEFDVWTSAENASLGCSRHGGLLAGRRADHGDQLRCATALPAPITLGGQEAPAWRCARARAPSPPGQLMPAAGWQPTWRSPAACGGAPRTGATGSRCR